MPRLKKDKPLGKRMQEIRATKGLSIEFLANETGFSADYISSVEKGETVPPVAAILRLSRALEIDSGILLKEEMHTADKRKAEGFRKRTEDYSYRTLTPEAIHKHLKAFKVFIDPVSDHKGVSYQHEGEEFIYVLKGTIEVTVGDNTTVLSPENSIHFNSSIVHKLKNVSSEKAELIVVLYTP
ncbi:MAG: XRE family transcriptional regulator [Deltaproteobacteria bacterium]|nr:helix-turn-helix transcriptional regulator [Deltaproteobacteria bacterium]MBW2078014.1 helix-turn-helix transcriptional regulator [Deltaproteobacteria bacterium]MBW2310603.1 helix-turn-helix transcriptional regulator [Deltaproteobacteria bacterium]RLB30541.1 MAG: XRE family transcriptional regulator [Deltaproteobacteria bacterium]